MIHQYKMFDQNIVLDICSGSIHVVDEIAYDMIAEFLDKDKNAWMQAIKQDNLTWEHVGELKDFEGETVRLYQVEAIPSSFLLDPQGKIIARDLRGPALDDFLNKTLPQP